MLDAVVARVDVLAGTGATAALPQGFVLLPVTADTFHRGVEATLAAWPARGPVAYVQAEYFGGVGEQSAQVWDAGELVFGPLELGENEPLPAAGTPISQALRILGVLAIGGNELDAVGLGDHG